MEMFPSATFVKGRCCFQLCYCTERIFFRKWGDLRLRDSGHCNGTPPVTVLKGECMLDQIPFPRLNPASSHGDLCRIVTHSAHHTHIHTEPVHYSVSVSIAGLYQVYLFRCVCPRYGCNSTDTFLAVRPTEH